MVLKKTKRKIRKILLKYAPSIYTKIRKQRLKRKMIALYSRKDKENVLTLYALGMIDFRRNYDFNNLKKIIEPSNFCIAYLKEYDQNKIKRLNDIGISGVCISHELKNDNNPDYLIEKNSYKIFNCKNFKIGVINFDYRCDKNTIFKQIEEIKEHVQYLIAYISYNDFNDEIDYLMEAVSNKCNQVIGINEREKTPIATLENNTKNKKKKFLSIGSFISCDYKFDEEKMCVILKNVIKKYDEKIINLEKCYIPCLFDIKSNTIKKLDVSEEKTRNIYRIFNRNITNINDEERILTVEKIFKILDMDIPVQYEDFKSIVVKDICVFPRDIGKCSVLFIRDYDGVIHSDSKKIYYKKIIKKLRKKLSKGLIIVFSPIKLPSDIPHVMVKSSLEAHKLICKHIIDSCYFDIKVAVTGSTGKTSAKEMISLVLEQQFETVKNNGNENLQIGLSKFLKELSPKYEAYVQEVGGGKINGASNFSKMMTPDIGVITNVGYSHLRWSRTREQLAINKLGIADGIRNNGILLINLDNDILQKSDVSNRNVITYAIDNKNADYYAENITFEENKVLFDIVHKNHRTSCILNVPGKYNIYNALIAFAIGKYLNISDEKICKGIANFKPEGIRQTLTQVGGYNLFVDCYNAAPNSMIGAVETLEQINSNGNKKIAVLADMTGFEDLTKNLHFEVGEKISKLNIDYLICYGNDIKYVYDSFNNPNTTKFLFNDKKEVIKTIKDIIKPGDYILFKGSSKFKLEEHIIDEIFGTNFSVLSHARKKKILMKKEDIKYQLYPTSAHVFSINDTLEPNILEKIKNKDVISIAKGAGQNCEKIQTIKLPNSLRNIQEMAFKGCSNLFELKLPNDTRIIENNVFEDCFSLTNIDIGDNLIHIGSEAFKNCKSLSEIKLSETINFIGDKAFDGCSNIKIICKKDSYVDVYAKANNIETKYY